MNKRVFIFGVGIVVGLGIILGCLIFSHFPYKRRGNEICTSGQTFMGSGEIFRTKIEFLEEESEREYEVSIQYGCLFETVNQLYGVPFLTETTRKSGEAVFWDYMHLDSGYQLTAEDTGDNRIYMDIIERESGYIVGWAVVEIVPDVTFSVFESKLIEHIHYPKIGGKYQEISLKDISSLMEKAKHR